MIWRAYLPDFSSFRVPASILSKGRFSGEDFFWDTRGLLLFHARSTVFLSAMPEQQGSPPSLAELTWRSLMDVLEALRGRWHLYIDLNATLDEIAANIVKLRTGQPGDILQKMMARREVFVKALGYSLPYSQTASHLIELARAGERDFELDELFTFTMRKFEALNWLYGDFVEKERQAFLTGSST
jgi:hypothetical protein